MSACLWIWRLSHSRPRSIPYKTTIVPLVNKIFEPITSIPRPQQKSPSGRFTWEPWTSPSVIALNSTSVIAPMNPDLDQSFCRTCAFVGQDGSSCAFMLLLRSAFPTVTNVRQQEEKDPIVSVDAHNKKIFRSRYPLVVAQKTLQNSQSLFRNSQFLPSRRSVPKSYSKKRTGSISFRSKIIFDKNSPNHRKNLSRISPR